MQRNITNQKNILKVMKRGNNEREKEQVTATATNNILTIY